VTSRLAGIQGGRVTEEGNKCPSRTL